MKVNKKRLKNILEIPGISGREFLVSSFLEKVFLENGFEINYDNLGSLIATKKSNQVNAKKLLIDAHMDEVGFMVTDISENGIIKFEEHGYINNLILPLARVRVWNSTLTSYKVGIINIPDLREAKSVPPTEKMFIDLGYDSKKEIEKFGITIGSVITFDEEAIFNGDSVITKAADDRVGISLLVDIAEYVKDKKLPYDLILAATIQEEVGIRGARTTAYKVSPDLVITLDTSPSQDLLKTSGEGQVRGGVMLRHKDGLYITPNNVVEYLRGILTKNKISFQDYFSNGGTNAYAYSLSKEGIQVLPLGILVRNIHTGSIIFSIKDYSSLQKQISSILADLNKNLKV